MADLTGLINQNTPGQVVEEWRAANQRQRVHLGLSEVGHPCPRYLWYRHHGYPQPPIDGRILRLFRLGEQIEEQAIIDLKSAGYTINSNQKEVSFTMDGVTLRGHIDGVIEGLVESAKPHLFECKSASAKQFAKLKKEGYEKWNPKYKGQIHVYMMGLKLNRCLAWVECKDNSEIHTERIKIDREYAVRLMETAFRAIGQTTPPERKCPRPDWYEAKWCNYYGECFR